MRVSRDPHVALVKRLVATTLVWPVVLAVILTAINSASFADQIYWQGSIDTWSTASNWVDYSQKDQNGNYVNQVPGASDTAVVDNGGGAQISSGNAAAYYLLVGPTTGSVTISGGSLATSYIDVGQGGLFDQTDGTTSATQLSVIGGYVSAYQLEGGALNASFEYIGTDGFDGTGKFFQTGGTNTISSLYIAPYSGASGAYTLSGTGSLSVSGSEYLGLSGSTGTFNQSGGTNTVGGGLYLGYYSGSTGIYTLGGNGSLSVSANEYVGYGGTGSFVQTGGTNAVVSNHSIILGNNAGASGTYTLSGTGSVTVDGNEYVGSSGTGNFNQSGGTNTISSGYSLYLGNNAGSIGTYTLSGTGALSIGGTEYVGNIGTGTFNQSGGTNVGQAANPLILGQNVGSSGTYNLTGGTITLTSPPVDGVTYFSEVVGNSGTGVFNQSGGTQNINQSLALGAAAGSSGTFNLSGTGSLNVTQNEYIGWSGTGTFSHTGSTNTASYLQLGGNSGGMGSYALSGTGTLSVSGYEDVGYSGTGNFNQTGGTNISGGLDVGYIGSGAYTQSGGTNTVSQNIYLGYNAGATGTYTLSGAGSLILNGGNEVVGNGGTGTFTQTGGTNKLTNAGIQLADTMGSAGTYSLSGTGTVSTPFISVGFEGTGDFSQAGGTVTVTDTLYLSENGGNGTFNLSAGALSVNDEFVGFNGTGTFNQTGGTHTITLANGGIQLGHASGSAGTYSLSGTGNILAPFISVGYQGTGNFYQSAGTITVTDTLYVAENGGTGTYALSGSGSLSVAGNVNIGNSGTGTFTQSGGTAAVTGILTMGNNVGSKGTYSLFGPGSLSVNTYEQVGFSGNGTFGQGGSTNTTNGLYVGVNSGSTGAYTLSGGSLTVNGNECVGLDGSGTFAETTGTHTVTGGLFLGAFTGSTGLLSFRGGTITVGTLGVGSAPDGTSGAGRGTVSMRGGTLAATTILIGNSAGGSGTMTISGNATVTASSTQINTGGQLNYDNGSFSPGSLMLSGGGTMSFGAGQNKVLKVSSLSIDSASTLDLNDNAMIVENGNLSDINLQLKGGFNPGVGYWNGTGGIVSTAAAADVSFLTTLGCRLSGGGLFKGVNTTTSDVLVMYTYYGDADLDGTVDGADYQQIDNGFGLGLTGWSNGDFNYDGVVDGSDFSLIDNTFNQLTATGASPLALAAGSADLIASPDTSNVPEPTGLALLGMSAVRLLARRRRGA